jgi:hypothetical protein
VVKQFISAGMIEENGHDVFGFWRNCFSLAVVGEVRIQLVWFEPLQGRISVIGGESSGSSTLCNYLGSVTAPSVFPHEFALLEMIAELSNGHRAGTHWPDAGV